MNYDLVKFPIPGDFVVAWGLPTPCELAYGYKHGWIGASEAVQSALAGYGVVPEPPAAYEELALLLSDNLDRVPDLIEEIARAGDPLEDCASIWLYLALAWVFGHRGEYRDAFLVVEQLYADFGYPSEIESFVRFLPVGGGLPTGEAALYGRWSAYLERTGAQYRSRFQRC
jgi:hypothetical protein